MKTPSNIQAALNFEGMTTEMGLAIMDRFLQKSMKHNPDGLCFEFGTYKGRTAALIAGRLGKEGWLHALEQADYLEFDRLKTISPRVTWHKSKSEQFCQSELVEVIGEKQVSFTHHDASHFFDNVNTELTHLVDKMGTYGVMVLDDFSDSFPQVRAAYYYLRYACSFPYELLLIGFNKAILVHQDQFDYFEDYVLNELLDELDQFEAHCMLCRTDISAQSRNFFLKTRTNADSERLYGTKWWGMTFYQPSRIHLTKK